MKRMICLDVNVVVAVAVLLLTMEIRVDAFLPRAPLPRVDRLLTTSSPSALASASATSPQQENDYPYRYEAQYGYHLTKTPSFSCWSSFPRLKNAVLTPQVLDRSKFSSSSTSNNDNEARTVTSWRAKNTASKLLQVPPAKQQGQRRWSILRSIRRKVATLFFALSLILTVEMTTVTSTTTTPSITHSGIIQQPRVERGGGGQDNGRFQRQQPSSSSIRSTRHKHNTRSSSTNNKQIQRPSSLIQAASNHIPSVVRERADSVLAALTSSSSSSVIDASSTATSVSSSPASPLRILTSTGVLVAAASAGTAMGQRLAVIPRGNGEDDWEDISKTTKNEDNDDADDEDESPQQNAQSEVQIYKSSITTTSLFRRSSSRCDDNYSEFESNTATAPSQLKIGDSADASAWATGTTSTAANNVSMDVRPTLSSLRHRNPYSTEQEKSQAIFSSSWSTEESFHESNKRDVKPHPNPDFVIQAFLNRTLPDALQREQKLYSTRSRRSPERKRIQQVDSKPANSWVQRALEQSEQRLREKVMLELLKDNNSNENSADENLNVVKGNLSEEQAALNACLLDEGLSSSLSSSSFLETAVTNATINNISLAELSIADTLVAAATDYNSTVKVVLSNSSLNPMTTSDKAVQEEDVAGIADSTQLDPFLGLKAASTVVKTIVNETEQLVKAIEEHFRSSLDLDSKEPTPNITLDKEETLLISNGDGKIANESRTAIVNEAKRAYNPSGANESFTLTDMGLAFFNDVVHEKQESVNVEPTASHKEKDEDCVDPFDSLLMEIQEMPLLGANSTEMSFSDDVLIDVAKQNDQPLLDGATREVGGSVEVKKCYVSQDFKKAFLYKPGEMAPIVESNESLESLISLRRSNHTKEAKESNGSRKPKLALIRTVPRNSDNPTEDQHNATDTIQSDTMNEKEAAKPKISLIRSDSPDVGGVNVDTALHGPNQSFDAMESILENENEERIISLSRSKLQDGGTEDATKFLLEQAASVENRMNETGDLKKESESAMSSIVCEVLDKADNTVVLGNVSRTNSSGGVETTFEHDSLSKNKTIEDSTKVDPSKMGFLLPKFARKMLTTTRKHDEVREQKTIVEKLIERTSTTSAEYSFDHSIRQKARADVHLTSPTQMDPLLDNYGK